MGFLQSDQTQHPSATPGGLLGPVDDGRTPSTPAPASETVHDAFNEPRTAHLRRWLLPAVALLIAVVATVVTWRSLPTPHIMIEVFNDTGAPMSGVRFIFDRGRGLREREKIAAGTTVAWEVTGQSEGFLLEYREPDGRVVTRKCDLAIDGDDWGSLTLHVKRGGLKVLTEVEVPAKR